jgi:hypothetical protein
LGRLSKESVQVLGFLWSFVTSPTPNPQAGGPLLVDCARLFIQHIRSILQNWRGSPPSATWGRAMPWWQGNHLTWEEITTRWENSIRIFIIYTVHKYSYGDKIKENNMIRTSVTQSKNKNYLQSFSWVTSREQMTEGIWKQKKI